MKLSSMTLGRFAAVVGASPRWVQNALQALDLPPVYDEERAKTLGLARVIRESLGVPLVEAHPIAKEALASWPKLRRWRREDSVGIVVIEVDLERYLSSYASRLAFVRSRYSERKRGRRPRRRTGRLAAAAEHGVDIGLIRRSLASTPEERLQRLDDDVAFLQSLVVEDRVEKR